MPAIGQLQDIWDACKTLTILDTWYRLPRGKNWLRSVCKSDLKVTFPKLSSVNQEHKCCFWQSLQTVLYPNMFNPLSSSWLPDHTLNKRWWELAVCNSLNVENELELFIIQLWKLWNNYGITKFLIYIQQLIWPLPKQFYHNIMYRILLFFEIVLEKKNLSLLSKTGSRLARQKVSYLPIGIMHFHDAVHYSYPHSAHAFMW